MKNLSLLLAYALCLTLTSCGKQVTDGSSVSESNSSEKIARATQTLRLGQTTSSNSPVAVSAAIDNFESLVGLGRTRLNFILYTTSAGNIVRITLDELFRPTVVETKDTTLTFSDYTGSSVSVTTGGSSATVSLDSAGSLKSTEIPSSSFKELSVLTLRERLNAASRAIRTFGCASEQASNLLTVSSQFATTSRRSCRSLLADAVRVRVDRNDTESIPVSPELSEPTTCDPDQPGWAENFRTAQSCAANLGTQLVNEVLKENPSIATEIDENADAADIFEEELGDEFDDILDDTGSSQSGGSGSSSSSSGDGTSSSGGDTSTPGDDDTTGGDTPIDDTPVDDTPTDDIIDDTPPDLPQPPLPGTPQPGLPQ